MDRNDLEQKKINEINLKKYLLFVKLLDRNDLQWKKINEMNLKTPTVRRLLDQNDLKRENKRNK